MVMVNVYQAKTHLSRLLTRVEAGEEIVIARNGSPVARLAPIKKQGARKPGALQGNKAWEELSHLVIDPLSEEELVAWEGTA